MSRITPEKRALTQTSDTFKLLKKIRGEQDRATRHDVTRYTWWGWHEGSATSGDRTFSSKRMALLYVAKRNSENLMAFAEAKGKRWSDLFASEGPYALHPNTAFQLSSFVDMSDAEVEVYANAVCDSFARHKVEKGSCYRYAPRESEEMGEEELLKMLQRDKPSAGELEHHKRQALLLSDIAGFD